jgi:hypothetical protein
VGAVAVLVVGAVAADAAAAAVADESKRFVCYEKQID